MKIFAPAKLNLFLRVTGRRSDGYHNIETLFFPLKFPGDDITVTEKSNAPLRVDTSLGDQLPCDLDNLAGRAAEEYRRVAGLDISWDIFIDKKIPLAAGLGGGSSDAGTLLQALNDRYCRLDAAQLAKIARNIGADVPFFLHPCPAIGRGIGEELTFFDFELPELPLLVVSPNFPVSAKWAYAKFSPPEQKRGSLDELVAGLQKGDLELVGKNLHNDLAGAIYDKFPLQGLMRGKLLEYGALGSEISGSGPTLFALFASRNEALEAGNRLAEEFEPLRVFVN